MNVQDDQRPCGLHVYALDLCGQTFPRVVSYPKAGLEGIR